MCRSVCVDALKVFDKLDVHRTANSFSLSTPGSGKVGEMKG